MAEAALGLICVVLVFAIPIGLLIGAALLMAAVAITNKCLPVPPSRYDDYEDDWEDEDPQRPRKRNTKTAIPAPTFNRAVVIVLVNALAGFVGGLVLSGVAGAGGLANNQGAMLLIQGVQIVLGFLIAASVLTQMLPTTFPRACLVVLFQYLIMFAIAIVIAIPLLLIGFAGAGLR
ncbi:hypothetical protein J8F10_19800 [Gemmata sp. G18]|uniref:Uncharacterized protein n=1 Tax=Gemmata palustris TaxID=2822762 RepID=A0ABS5BUU2_9BACT|nr:hypothetical protein [Gemmata palustris]MBP3957498.1 hypothetical protein [Gemmata palustris]